jgi:hypothetical protein
MNLNDLKLVALYYIKESELTNEDQISLMEYVDKSEESDILFLLATGCRSENYLEMIEDGNAYTFQEFVGGVSASLRGAQGARIAVKAVRAGMKGAKFAKSLKDYDPSKEKNINEKPWGLTTQHLGATAFQAFADAVMLKVKRGYIDKNIKKCEKETGDAKRSCYNKIRKDAIRAQIVALNAMKIKCRKTTDEKKCLKKADIKIKELQTKMQIIKV